MKTEIIVEKNGDSQITGLEQSEQCHELSDLAQKAGKVMSEEDKDHTPVHQDVNNRGQ